MSVAFLFPGQGSQTPRMLHHLLDHAAVARTLDEISAVLHSDVLNFDGEQCLESDVSVQIALLAAGVATAQALMEQGIQPAAVAGLSVGAFAAAVVAGVLALRDAIELVRLRAEQMIKLYPAGFGLAAIVGLSESRVAAIVEDVSSHEAPVFVGNINAPRQIVIAGADAALNRVLDEARGQGASKAVRLHVSVPSHCPLLQPVADLLAQRISSLNLSAPQITYLANVNGRALRTKEAVASDLANNIAHGVRWYDATVVLHELGCNLFLEMPPGHVLSDLARESLSDVNAIPIDTDALPKALRLVRLEEAIT
jgi:malonate decarboxylase epsilon subunit